MIKTTNKGGDEMEYKFGIMEHGKRNLITDVAGVTVGHFTLSDGVVQTGVRAILPHQSDAADFDKYTFRRYGFHRVRKIYDEEKRGNRQRRGNGKPRNT